MTQSNKTEFHHNNTSQLLIFSVQQNHEAEVLLFLQQNKLIDVTQPHTNLVWINQDGLGVKIKAIRELISQCNYGSYDQQRQIFVILHSDQSSIPAQNALLKILEEPPAQSQLILTTSQPELLLPTIHSRCEKLNLSLLKPQDEPSSELIIQTAKQIANPSFNHAQAIELAEQYPKREEALQFLSDLISYLHHNLEGSSDVLVINRSHLAGILIHVLQAYQDLRKNLNVRLALEHCFFQITQSIS